MIIFDYPSVLDPNRKINMLEAEQLMESAKKLRELNGIRFITKSEEEPRPLNIIKNKQNDKR